MAFWKNTAKDQKKHPDFPENLPAGMRLGGIVKFDDVYWLLNGQAVSTKHPGDNLLVKNVCMFNLFGLSIFRAGLDDDMRLFHQVMVDNEGVVLDGVLFQLVDEVYPQSEADWKNWLESLIGWKDITTPDGKTFLRDWMPVSDGGGDFEEPESVTLRIFDNMNTDPKTFRSEMMLFSRSFPPTTLLPANSRKEEWEYLTIMAVKDNNPRILIHAGAPIPMANVSYV